MYIAYVAEEGRQLTKQLMTLDVRGLPYKIFLYSNNEYKKRHPGSYACMVEVDKEIHFNVQYRDLKTIRHEVAHAYIKSCFLDYTDETSVADFEEVVCEVISHFCELIIKNSNLIKEAIEKEIRENGKSFKVKQKRNDKKTKR